MRIKHIPTVCRQRLKLLTILLSAYLWTFAMADEVGDVYGGISYSQTIAKDESPRNLGTYRPTTVGVGVSVVAIPNLALDGYVFAALSDATNSLSASASMTVNAKEGYGFNLRPYISLSPSWSVYAKLGRQYGTQETTLRRLAGTTYTSTNYAHTLYGIGISYTIDARWGVGLDYTKSKRIPSESISASLIGMGLRYKF